MRQYVLKRVLLVFPTLLLVTMIVFGLVRLLPGDVVVMMLQEQAYAEDVAALRAKLGLDRPIYEQYGNWIIRVVQGDLGESLFSRRPVVEELGRRIPVSLELGFLSLLISLCISIPIGVLSAIRQDSWADYLGRVIAIALISIPGFWLATIVIVLPSVWFKWTPPLRYTTFTEDPMKNLQHVIVPAVLMGAAMAGGVMRMTRTMMLEVLRQDYIRTAWAKGLRERVVIWRHALKNAMMPVVTILGLQIAFLVGGTVIMEQIFVIPGMGRYMLEAISQRDYPIVQGVNIVFAAVIVTMNLIVDVSYGLLDPRVRFK